VDALLAELFREPADPRVRPDGPAARILRDLWLGGMPLPRAATAAGLISQAAEETLRHLGLLTAEPGRGPLAAAGQDQGSDARDGVGADAVRVGSGPPENIDGAPPPGRRVRAGRQWDGGFSAPPERASRCRWS